jgi:hypothetical protein
MEIPFRVDRVHTPGKCVHDILQFCDALARDWLFAKYPQKCPQRLAAIFPCGGQHLWGKPIVTKINLPPGLFGQGHQNCVGHLQGCPGVAKNQKIPEKLPLSFVNRWDCSGCARTP